MGQITLRASSMPLTPAICPPANMSRGSTTCWLEVETSDLDYRQSTGWGQFVAHNKKGKDAHVL